jgi:hypothetical protein
MEANSVFLDSGRMPDVQLEQNQVAMNNVDPPMYQPQNHSGIPPNFGSPPGPISAMNNLLMDYTPTPMGYIALNIYTVHLKFSFIYL